MKTVERIYNSLTSIFINVFESIKAIIINTWNRLVEKSKIVYLALALTLVLLPFIKWII